MPMTQACCVSQAARTRRPQQGFTMLEVLVSLLILLIGLLGLAGLLVTTQQGEVEAYQRKQATVLLQDMVDRITANPVAAATCYAITNSATGAPALGTGYGGSLDCGSISPWSRGTADLQAWNNALLGTSENKAGANVGGIIEARGCVSNTATGVYAVSVAWRGLAPSTLAPLVTRNACGKDQYKDASNAADERLRRVISVTIRIADLKAP